jgi:hypothetical protein
MAIRDTLIATATRNAAQAWATGPTAIYAAFPNITPTQDGPTRANLNAAQAIINAGPQDFQNPPYPGYVSGSNVPLPGTIIAASQFVTVFFGWAERVPTIRIRPVYRPRRTDAGGDEPHDHFYGGASATVHATMTVWNEAAYAVMQSYTGNFYRGQDLMGSVGRAMAAEGGAFQLFLVFPYAAKFVYNTMPPGYRFMSVWLQDDGGTPGSAARKLHLAWKCQRLFNAADGSYTLYDGNMSQLAGVAVSAFAINQFG